MRVEAALTVSTHLGRRAFARLEALGEWLDEQRTANGLKLLLFVQLSIAIILLALGLCCVKYTSDFLSFYAAGHLADSGSPALVYNRAAHAAAETALGGPGVNYKFFFYPPVYLLFCAILARLPFWAAIALFEFGSFVLLGSAIRRISGVTWRKFLVPILAFPPTMWTAVTGQNAFLSSALLAWGLLTLEDDPAIAGIFLGALVFKPHLGLVLPIALIAGRKWRAFFSASATVIVLFVLSIAIFGSATWLSFLHNAMSASGVYDSGILRFSGFATPFGAVRTFGGGSNLAIDIQAVVSILTAIVVAIIWGCKYSDAGRCAVLVSAIPLMTPIGFFYDLMIEAVAITWLVRAGLRPWERGALLVLLLLLAMRFPFFPGIAFSALGIFALALVHALFERHAPNASHDRSGSGISERRAGDIYRRKTADF